MADVVEAPPFRKVRIGIVRLRATEIQRVVDWGGGYAVKSKKKAELRDSLRLFRIKI